MGISINAMQCRVFFRGGGGGGGAGEHLPPLEKLRTHA